MHRSRRRYQEAVTRAARLEPVAEPADSSVDAALAQEWRRELVAAVRTLTAGEREVIASRFLLDRSEAETAAQLDLPVGTVKSRTSRALARLRAHLGVAIAVTAVVAAVLALPPARAAVARAVESVLRFAGVQVQLDDSGARRLGVGSGQPLPATRTVSLAEARRLAPFPVGVPTSLGAPERVEVSDPAPSGAPRVVSLFYRDGTVRVDEFDGHFDLAFTKTTDDYRLLTIEGITSIWLPNPHTLTYVDSHGESHVATARLAGPTLLWEYFGVGYRIEGFATPAEAAAVAASVMPG
jgi:hypothetical protein